MTGDSMAGDNARKLRTAPRGPDDGWDDLTRLAEQLDTSTRPPAGLSAEERRAWVTAALRGPRRE